MVKLTMKLGINSAQHSEAIGSETGRRAFSMPATKMVDQTTTWCVGIGSAPRYSDLYDVQWLKGP